MRGAVWTALLQQRYVYEDTKILVLEPSLLRDNSELIDRPRAAPADAWRAWRVADRRGGRLPEDFDPGLPVTWFTDKDWWLLPEGKDLSEGRWEPFHQRFPGNSGHISLGPIGFSRDGRTAVVAGFVGSGMLSASGDLHVLRLVDGAWKVVDSFNYIIA
jgi:hypothetical protein